MESGKAETQMECRLGGLNSKRLSAKDISEYISHRDSFGLGWLLLQNIRLCEDSFPFTILDLSDFSLSNGKLDFLLSTTTAPETLKLGPRVCTEDFFPAVLTFLQRLKGSEEEEEEEEEDPPTLRVLPPSYWRSWRRRQPRSWRRLSETSIQKVLPLWHLLPFPLKLLRLKLPLLLRVPPTRGERAGPG
mmetsp:Transcript_38613/g.75832  ORF Transcript_38613/g.75832 Transcript_38613/m.75832 type:complete len:189 (+) Transcript_38613:275-841(+)